jgi:hypothetical protein
MLTLLKRTKGSWEDVRAALAADLQSIEAVFNAYITNTVGLQNGSALRFAYPLGGSTHVAPPQTTANTFVDATNAYDVGLPAILPPGAVKVIVRCSAFTAGVSVTPRLIRTDTGASVGQGVAFTATSLVKWPTFQVQEFAITPVPNTSGVPIYYRLQVSPSSSTEDVFAAGAYLETGR